MKFEGSSIKKLDKTIEDLSKNNFFKSYNSIWRLFYISLIKGLASGLGWVIGATLLVSILTYILSQVEFIPIIGELVSRLIIEIESFNKSK